MPYIEAPKAEESGGNPFIKLPALGDDKAALIVHRGQTCFIILNKFPYNAGHLLVMPYRAVPELQGLDGAERAELMALMIHGQAILQAALQPHGFNVGFNFGSSAGAGIPEHLHCHIVPRWNGDTNFMPVLGETRVLPQSLELMWERLHSVAQGLPAPLT